mmetsp:Transcript_18969/g.44461  ORF Transcript_18969/g.44461 Transcript_18969/m.44461 type:complete len:221 (-) Transcript_18969:712-1374(-)
MFASRLIQLTTTAAVASLSSSSLSLSLSLSPSSSAETPGLGSIGSTHCRKRSLAQSVSAAARRARQSTTRCEAVLSGGGDGATGSDSEGCGGDRRVRPQSSSHQVATRTSCAAEVAASTSISTSSQSEATQAPTQLDGPRFANTTMAALVASALWDCFVTLSKASVASSPCCSCPRLSCDEASFSNIRNSASRPVSDGAEWSKCDARRSTAIGTRCSDKN